MEKLDGELLTYKHFIKLSWGIILGFFYRRLAIVEENTELTKTAKLAQVFKDIFTAVTSCKGKKEFSWHYLINFSFVFDYLIVTLLHIWMLKNLD